MSTNQQTILIIMISALLVVALTTFGAAFVQGDNSSASRLAAALSSNEPSGSNFSQPSSREPESPAKFGSAEPAVPQNQCYQTCMLDQSILRRALCNLGCEYPSDIMPYFP